MTRDAIHDLCDDIVFHLCAHPDDMSVEINHGNCATSATIKAHSADLRRIIGKHGRNFAALKELLAEVGDEQNHQIMLITVIDGGGDRSDLPRFFQNPVWDIGPLTKVLDYVVGLLEPDAVVEACSTVRGVERRLIIRNTVSNGRVYRQLRNLQELFNTMASARGGHLVIDLA